jgi:aminopeptidase N
MALARVGAATQEKVHVFGDPDVWHWAPSRSYHVQNYKLSLRFDEGRGEVFGDETITLRPFAAHFRKFYLNSTELTIDSVSLRKMSGARIALGYSLQAARLWITLDHEYSRATALNVRITYHGFPRTGLFFVNPTPAYPRRPREIYSQGEPELNQYWFPCWDYPNDMATSETITTVPERQMVVSNGRLLKVTRANGQATYDWLENVPHSSYLVSIAVGPWRTVSDKYRDKPVDYYVPTDVDEATARRSFRLTPDMIGFFSHATGVEYPYEKYAQITVENFLFGGQENVSATTLADTTLHDERADPDYPSTNLISHELGQHWFGDFVQGRDWANIWLNEGFATYLEALYTQYHEGYDAYRFAIYNDQLTEQKEGRDDYRRAIVDRHYSDPLDMFDATTHEKGAAVLDMLRYVLDTETLSRPASQDEQLFRSLHYYLMIHRAQTADTADLIASIRSTTGHELDWFFREWVFMAGHPDYRVQANYYPAAKTEKITITQTQQTNAETPIFEMPIELAFYGANGERKTSQVQDRLQQQEFEIPVEFEPQWVDFDPEDFIDKTVQFEKPLDSLVAEAEQDASMMSRLWAVEQLGAATSNPDRRVDALSRVLDRDAFYGVRAAAATNLGLIRTDQAERSLLSAFGQPDSRVRTAAVEALGAFSKDEAVFNRLVDALEHDRSYAVEAAAARQLGETGTAQAFNVLQAEALTNQELHVTQAVLAGLARTGDPRAAEILLAYARPGVCEQIRVSALTELKNLKVTIAQNYHQGLVSVVRAALHDGFYPLQAAGEKLVGAYHLLQFEPEIREQAEHAPLAIERRVAENVLVELYPQK